MNWEIEILDPKVKWNFIFLIHDWCICTKKTRIEFIFVNFIDSITDGCSTFDLEMMATLCDKCEKPEQLKQNKVYHFPLSVHGYFVPTLAAMSSYPFEHSHLSCRDLTPFISTSSWRQSILRKFPLSTYNSQVACNVSKCQAIKSI